MTRIQTYVFLDLETTGKDQTNRTKITEISLVAVKREHLLDTRIGCSPRVQHKLTLCVNPRKRINPGATGLCNDLLEFEPTFDNNLINLLNMFLNLLTKPVCLISYNGLRFDFPILRNHLEKFGAGFAEDVACADCFHAFYYTMEMRKTNRIQASTFIYANDIPIDSDDDMELLNYISNMKSRNERSPSPSISMSCVTPKKPNCVRLLETGKFVWRDGGNANKMETSTYVNTNNSETESDDDMELLKNINTCATKSRNNRSPSPLISLSPVTPKKLNCVRMMETAKCLWQDGENTNKMETSTYVNTNNSKIESDDDMELLKNINTCETKSRNYRSPSPLISLSPVTPKKPNCVRMMETAKCLWQDGENANNMETSTYVNTNNSEIESDDDMELLKNINTCETKSRNNRSPSPLISLSPVTPKKLNHVRMEPKSFPWPEGKKPKEKYKLRYIYEQLLNRPARNPHQAENDCIFALECAVALSEEFVKWVDDNNYLFSQIRPMTIGAPLGK